MLGEEVDIVAAVVEDVLYAVFYELLGEVHVVGDVVECHFGLNHPELREVARRERTLGAERGAEGVDCTEGRGAKLALELSADGECGGAAEEVLAIVYGAVFGLREVAQRQGRHLEHRSGTLAVTACD